MNLEDYTVLDLTWLLPGPYGTMLLADMGAEVIKVEEPERGDYARWLEPEVDRPTRARSSTRSTAIRRASRSI